MNKKLNRSQLNKIALMWSATQIINCGLDSFEDDFPQGGEVVDISHKIGLSLLNGLPVLNSLPDIIEYISKNKKP